MKIGDRIKARRNEVGYSVEQLAEILGKNKATVYRYENNSIENFPISSLEPLAKALKTTPAHLMGFAEDSLSLEPSMKGQPFWINYNNISSSVKENESTYEFKEVSEDKEEEQEKDMTIKVKDDAMDIFGIKKGDTIYIQEQKHAENGDIVAVVENGIIIVRTYYFDGKNAVLIGNRKTTPIFEDFQIIGVVKYVKSKI